MRRSNPALLIWLRFARNDAKRLAVTIRHGTSEGPGVFEVVDHFDGDTWRAVYTVRFRHVVYVLHAFQKKSPRGRKTARTDVELIAHRLKIARQDYEARHGKSER